MATDHKAPGSNPGRRANQIGEFVRMALEANAHAGVADDYGGCHNVRFSVFRLNKISKTPALDRYNRTKKLRNCFYFLKLSREEAGQIKKMIEEAER